MARSTLYPILVVLFLMSAIEIGLFYHCMPTEGIVYAFDDIVQWAHLRWVFAGAFAVISFFLTRTGCEHGSKVGYTLKRLSVSERQVFALQSIYNVLFYLLLWVVQVLLAIGLSYYYVQNTPTYFVTGQTIFLSFYRNAFFHALMPFEDIMVWVSNISLLLALGICTACYPMRQRRGQVFSEVIVLVGAAILLFPRGLGDPSVCVITIVVSVLCAIFSLQMVMREEQSDES